ncbi:uncharacterized protein MKK02DRAFT_19524 [Dioszegia hungarica]|uniref:ubiquitinyl hydrolase 1 n=1 Tax=Dioszegia hungarica TaxID=4972 RepID=A0AA38HFQ1_9TREE|nr:uncharacterized protein MKK02DRAFT_19524 [Dioszegia hungarica]KAI9639805.1 hypothetical protein MKK02DRAFT_19524 [Dioszegia hungarica]
MEKREVVGNTKRRRRVEGAGTDCESNPPCFGWEEAGLTGVADKGFYPGMVNLSGTLCYMNSVLQSFASIPSLVTHLERIIALAVELDVPTPIADTLIEVLQDLNTPSPRPRRPIRPTSLLSALSTLPTIQRLLGTREQQDAHELFLVLADAVSVESIKVAGEVSRSRGLGEVLTLQGWAAGKAAGLGRIGGGGMGMKKGEKEEAKRRVKRQRGLAQPWEGLMARRRVCKVCGWCEAVRMEPVGGMELSLPQSGDVSLDACIAQYLAPELLTGVTCEMCSLRRTHAHYQAEVERLSNLPSSSAASSSKPIRAGSAEMTPARRKRAKEAKRLEGRLASMLESGTVSHFGEFLLPPPSAGPSTAAIPIKWQTANTNSVRAALITRPPQTLRLHLIRSEYTPYGVLLKKSARVGYPVVLDLTRFVTRGIWDERTGVLGALAETGEGGAEGKGVQRRVLYRLESVILHYGYTHSSGHYVCIRRKPTATRSTMASSSSSTSSEGTSHPGSRRPTHITKSCPDGCTCESCAYFGQVREEETIPGKGWLRVSDDEVEEVGEEALVGSRSQVVMLFYERVGEYAGPERKEGKIQGQGQAEKGRMEGEKRDREEDYKLGRRTPEGGQHQCEG